MTRGIAFILKMLALDGLYVALIAIGDALVNIYHAQLPWFDVSVYFQGTIFLTIGIMLTQVFYLVRHFLRKNTRRGFFYLFHFVVWLGIVYLVLLIHFALLMSSLESQMTL